MKKKLLFLLIAGVALLFPAFHAWRDHDSGKITFVQGESRFTIDSRTAAVVVTDRNGAPVELLGSPAAGDNEVDPSSQPVIIHYLLPGKGSISGLVWDDLNGNGNPDNDEKGVPGARVYLDQDASGSYSEGEPTVFTGEDGLYTIQRVRPGARSVAVDTPTLPAGYGVFTGNPVTVNLVPHQKITDIDFGASNRTGTITGLIWDQTDNLPLPGIITFLDLNHDGSLTSGEPFAVTSTTGTYRLEHLAGGTYSLLVDNTTLDSKYHRTPASGTNPTVVSLSPGGNAGVDLAYLHKATICGALVDNDGRQWGNITIFIDLNGNDAYDAGEPSVVTDVAGRYCFDELFPGTYTLKIMPNQLPAGYDLLISPGTITVVAGEDSTANFITHQPVTITGLVWDDASGNRVSESAEKGLADILVYLDANNNGTLDSGEQSARTDASGVFTFSDLVRSTFMIRVDDTLLRGYTRTTPANPIVITLDPGQVYDGARFGYQKKLAPMHTPSYPTRLSWASDGKLYVSDNQLNAVFIYDNLLNLTGELKNLDRPLGVVTDGAGNIYVGNEGRKNVEVYDSLGNLLRTIGDGAIAMPNDLALDRANNLYVLDSAGTRVMVYDPVGNHLSTISGAPWTGFARSIAISYRGPVGAETRELYIADGAKSTIHVFGLDGTYKKSMGTAGSLYTTNWDGKFSGLTAVEIDRYGNVHGLDNNLNVVQVFEPQNGTFLRSYNAYPPANEFRLNLQTDLAIQPVDHRVIVSNLATRTIETVTTITAP